MTFQFPLFVSSKPDFHDEFENGLFAHPSTTGHLLGDTKLTARLSTSAIFEFQTSDVSNVKPAN